VRCALLLERAVPGITLKSLFPDNDDAAVAHAVTVMKRLHAVPVSNLTSFACVQDWLKALDKAHPALSRTHISKARELAQYLVATQNRPVLLHGDLHHENILSSSHDGWLAIDPKGVVGESAYEVGAFVRGPFPELLQ